MRNAVAALLLVSLLLSGCRINPQAEREIALLRAEILDLEDQYYSLQSRCQGSGFAVGPRTSSGVYQQGLTGEMCENCTPATVGQGQPFQNSVIYEAAPGAPGVIYNDPNSFQYADPVFLDSEGVESDPSIQGSDTRQQIDTDPDLETLPAVDEPKTDQSYFPSTESQNSILREPAPGEISSIVINRYLSQGKDVDGRPGHEGLALLVQPIDATGSVKKVAGHLTIRVVEPTSQQVDRQIGLWKFTPQETATFFVKDELEQQGILLHLPWNGLIPLGRQLSVFVQFVTDDQRNVEASLSLPIEPPNPNYSAADPLVAGWIERDDRWVDIPFDPRQPSQQPVVTERSPAFRVKSATTERRISTPQWRPVR